MFDQLQACTALDQPCSTLLRQEVNCHDYIPGMDKSILSLLGDWLEHPGSNADRSQDVSFAIASGPVRRPTSPLVQWVTLSVEPRVKQLEREADHPSRSNEHVRISGLTSLPPRIFFQWCLGKQEGKFRSLFKAQITTGLENLDVSNEQ
jgi:hypothetical protein